jgi:hypothetical protein
VNNANNEIEIVTRNYFGKKVSLEQQQQGIIRKIKKKLGEEIRKPDEELLGLNCEEEFIEQEDLAKPNKNPEEIRKSLKELGKSNNLEAFLASAYRELYEEEAEELEKLAREKGNLGENDQGVSYNLGRPDLVIL